MENLFEKSRQLVEQVESNFNRYLYSDINWEARMIGLTGPRGVGKTTMILQYIRNELSMGNTLYVTTEDFYFAKNKLVDLAEQFVKYGGKYLFIDEIHKYKDWSRELKLIYDYHPKLKVVFTGSSVLDIKKGAFDLSRRAIMYQLQGLSFREYLQLFHSIQADVYSLKQILDHKISIKDLKYPLPLFQDYLKGGYYPFALEEDFDSRMAQIITQTLESDIPFYADMNVSTGRKLKHMLGIISESVPFKPNFSKIANMLFVSRNSVADYLLFIEEAGMIAQLRNTTKGVRALGKVEKIFLDNPNLSYHLGSSSANIGSIRETFFFNQLRINKNVYASNIADFEIDGLIFEIGGKSKTQKQIAQTDNSYLVKDDLEYGYGNTIPLWHFGMMY